MYYMLNFHYPIGYPPLCFMRLANQIYFSTEGFLFLFLGVAFLKSPAMLEVSEYIIKSTPNEVDFISVMGKNLIKVNWYF
jgi:hypothetical protein